MHVAIVGGGIAGLAAAFRVNETDPHAHVTLIEASNSWGGKLQSGAVAGRTIEYGAEAFTTRQSEVLELAERLNLDVVYPHTTKASVFIDGKTFDFPRGTYMGIPADLDALRYSGIFSESVMSSWGDQAPAAHATTAVDVSVGEVVRRQFGDSVVERLVDPLLGGIYAGNADALSLQATMPFVAAELARQNSLLEATRQLLGAPGKHGDSLASQTPPVAGIRGGMSSLISALRSAIRARFITGETVVSIKPREKATSKWRLLTREGSSIDADVVIFACPAHAAGRILADVSPVAARAAKDIPYASVALVTFAFPDISLPQGSGVLIPVSEGYGVKALTFVSNKWGSGDAAIVRASVGRYGDDHATTLGDRELAELVQGELQTLCAAMGVVLPPAAEHHVQRWPLGLPQYSVGHVARVQQLRKGLPTGIAVAGAAYDGVGIPSCIRSGYSAAATVLSNFRG